jgi:YVTN family beta-propeller protein
LGVAVNPATNRIYVGNRGDDTVSVIDGETNAVVATIPVWYEPWGVAANPTTNRIYVSSRSDTVSVIDGATDAVVATVPVGEEPQGVTANPTTNRIYVANYGGHSVSVIDGATNTVVATVPVGYKGKGVAANPTTIRIYVANWSDDTVSVIEDFTDSDGDGCLDSEETTAAPPPKPGSTGAYHPLAWYDFYDVPVPANPDPTPNGARNQAVTIPDVLAVVFYVGACDNCDPNANGVDYDSLKDGDWNGDTVVDAGDEAGLRYDRSPSAELNPPWDAGPPDGAVNIQDLLAVLAQVGLSCVGPP